MRNLAGRKVKAYFRNNTILEGVVEEWSQDLAVLANGRGDLLIINNPRQDVMLIEVFAFEDYSDESEDPVESYPEEDIVYDDALDKRAHEMVKTRMTAISREKNQIKNLLTRAEPTVSKMKERYELPDFSQRIPNVRPSTKARRGT